MQIRILAVTAFAASLFTGIRTGAQSTEATAQVGAQASKDKEPATDKLVQVDAVTMDTMSVSKVAPVYPLEAKNAAIEGDVVLYAIVDEKGKVKSLDVISGTEILRKPALNAVNQWTYAPFIVDQSPVKVGTIITIHFRLSGNDSTP
jgi:TonB family protein